VSRDGASAEDRPPPTAVVLDWGGTLAVHVEVELIDLWRVAAEALAPDDVDGLTAALVDVERAVWARVTTTQRSARLMDLLREASDALGLDVADAVLQRAQDAHLDAWTPTIRHHPAAADVLGELRAAGLGLGLLSNTHWPRSFHERFLERDGLAGLLDQRLYTSEIDWVKPHPAPFELLAGRLGADPAACVVVGDRPIDDVEGGRAAGMRTVWIRNAYAPGDGEAADAVVDDLAEVPAVLRRWAAAGPR
jgi:putative hydrolase of the HAD superfamily